MSKIFSSVPLHELLCKSEERATLNPEETYREITIRLWGKSVVLRREVVGVEIGAGVRFLACKEQFILSRIDARNGAFGLVPDSLDGAVVTNDFPVFNLNRERLLPRYLELFSKTAGFTELCKAASEGTTNRIRLKEERFLAALIPLPPLEEQHRIVARIEELAAKIEEARGLRREAQLFTAAWYDLERDRYFRQMNCPRRPIAELFDLINGRAFKPSEWKTEGLKIIRIQNLKYPDASYNYFDGAVHEKHLVQKGDVLFAWSGQVVSLGAHIWQQDEAILNQHIFNVKAKQKMLPRFVQEGFNFLIDEMKHQVRGLEMFHIRKQRLIG